MSEVYAKTRSKGNDFRHGLLGLFDFPMIDNTRLTHNERASVTLTTLTEGQGEIVLSYFPASRASLKDKPFIDELQQDLKGKSNKER